MKQKVDKDEVIMKRWQRDKVEVCARLGADHIGGSGQPDCVGDDYIVEVKSYRGRRIDRGIIRRTIEKRWAAGQTLKMVSISGYTDGAIELAAYEGVELYIKEGGEVYSLSAAVEEERAAPTDDLFVLKVVAGIAAAAGVVGAVGIGIALLSGARRRGVAT